RRLRTWSFRRAGVFRESTLSERCVLRKIESLLLAATRRVSGNAFIFFRSGVEFRVLTLRLTFEFIKDCVYGVVEPSVNPSLAANELSQSLATRANAENPIHVLVRKRWLLFLCRLPSLLFRHCD